MFVVIKFPGLNLNYCQNKLRAALKHGSENWSLNLSHVNKFLRIVSSSQTRICGEILYDKNFLLWYAANI